MSRAIAYLTLVINLSRRWYSRVYSEVWLQHVCLALSYLEDASVCLVISLSIF